MELVEGLPSGLTRLSVEGRLLQGSVPSVQVSSAVRAGRALEPLPGQVARARDSLGKLGRLQEISLAGCGFLGGCAGGRLGRSVWHREEWVIVFIENILSLSLCVQREHPNSSVSVQGEHPQSVSGPASLPGNSGPGENSPEQVTEGGAPATGVE